MGRLLPWCGTSCSGKPPPDGGRGLLVSGYEEKTLRAPNPAIHGGRVGADDDPPASCPGGSLPQHQPAWVDTELCLIRLCDRRLSDTSEGVLSRLSRLEAQAAQGFPAAGAVPPAPPVEPVAEKPAPQLGRGRGGRRRGPLLSLTRQRMPLPGKWTRCPLPAPEPAPRPTTRKAAAPPQPAPSPQCASTAGGRAYLAGLSGQFGELAPHGGLLPPQTGVGHRHL